MDIAELINLIKCMEGINEKSTGFSKSLSIGKNIFIRTVTHYYTGRVKSLTSQFIELDDAAWIADTGRFHDFLKDGSCNEYEGFIDPVLIPFGAIVDITSWGHKLFTGKK